MNYAAVTAKICAMSANLLTSQDYEIIQTIESAREVTAWLQAKPNYIQTAEESAARICRYIPDKINRNFLMQMAEVNMGNIQYYTSQWKRLKQLDKANSVVIRGILGVEIDLNNILWMYRLKRYHRLKGDATYGYLIPIRYKLSQAITQRMAECKTPKELLDEIEKSPYSGELSKLKPTKGSRLTPEQSLLKIIERRYELVARRYPNTLIPALSYIHKKKLELNKLMSITESLQ